MITIDDSVLQKIREIRHQISENNQHNPHKYPLNKWGWTTCSGTILRHLRLVMEGFTPDY
ncbi:MAG: hypothetical protein ACK5RT_07110 [Dolichospermum sp.]